MSEKEQFVYHFLPDPMMGKVLYPLNQLKVKYPAEAEKHAEKYNWRLELQSRVIPGLNVLWNDVLHFSVLDPQKSYGYLAKLRGPRGQQRKVLCIPISALNEKHCVYFESIEKPRSNLALIHPEEIRHFSSESYREQLELSEDQKEKWRDNLSKNEILLLFSRTTHVLYQGHLDISEFEIKTIQT